MSFLRNAFFTALAALFLIQFAAAQDREDIKNATPEQIAEVQTKWMKTELSLTPEQVTAVREINLKYVGRNQAAMNSGGSRIKKARKLKSTSQEKDRELKQIFTPEQYKEYTEKKENLKKMLKEKAREKSR